MKNIVILLLVGVFTVSVSYAQVAVNTDGTAPDASAIFDASSTTMGLLIPRMLSSEIVSITNPATGLLAFSNDTKLIYMNNGTKVSPNWVALSTGQLWNRSGSNTD